MEKKEQVYVKLQRHLDNQPVGFPATRSKAEIRLLKHIFTPLEAEIATCLTYKFEPAGAVFARTGRLVDSLDELEKRLDEIQKKGGLELKIKKGRRHYCNVPLVVGMYEFQLNRLTPEFVKDFNTYVSDKKFGIEFLSTELPQMRTIPVAKSISIKHNASTFDEVAALVEQADAPFVIIECICRKKKKIEGKACKVTDREETCMAIGPIGQSVLLAGHGREIDRDEAMAILGKNQKQGLVLQPSNSEKAEFICSCCGCCCGMLDLHKKLPNPVEFWVSNFYAAVDPGACDGCGACGQRCQVGAVSVSDKTPPPAVVNLDRCIGCGGCVAICPKDALSLVKKEDEIRPPETREDLYDIIMEKKKSRFDKLKLQGKLMVDAVRTGRTDLLKKPV